LAVAAHDTPDDLARAHRWAVRDHLLATIDRLAAEHDAPRLQPHVTLAATFDSPEDAAAQTLKAVTAAMSPVDVTFTAIGHDQTYFRSLYLLPEPSAQLTALPGPGRGPGAGRDN
jgi:2'-5' RNA ligase